MALNNINCDINGKPIRTVNGDLCYTPNNERVNNLMFSIPEEANLADAVSRVGLDNGLTHNDIQHVMPFILRMLKSNSEWAK
jgi:hypothetical protein